MPSIMLYPKLVESKITANKIKNIEWNPGMDLLATVFVDGSLTCSRLLSLQKVWNKQVTGKINSISWRPDGRLLAIGAYNEKTKENVCTLHDVENGKKINSIVMEKSITSVDWFQYESEEDSNKIIIKKDNHKTDLTPKETFSHQLAHEQTQLNILVISTEDGRISFYGLGLFYLGDINLHSDINSSIMKTHMSSCLKYITSVIHSEEFDPITTATNQTSSIKILKLNTFQMRSNELLRVSKMYAKITDELEYLDDTINAITTSWADVLAGLDNKLSSYCSRKNKNPDDSENGYTFLSADELLQLLVIGHTSDNLEKFLSDMSDKGLKKLNNAIEQTCLRVQNLIVKNAQKCCYHLHGDLNLLRGMALWKERFKEVGLEDKFIVDAMKTVGSLMLKLTELQQVIDHSLKSTKSFFRWLISIACRMSGEQNNSIVPNDINKTTQQDIQLITDFILENFDYNSNDMENESLDLINRSDNNANTKNNTNNQDNIYSNRPTCSNFTLEQVGQYLKNEPLSRLKYSFAKPNSNFWIEFFKKRPELSESTHLDDDDGSKILLLYPHNPDTSLIQEHKKACKAIEAAFDSVATNIKLVLNSTDNFIDFKDFIKFAPYDNLSNRIRVEFNVKKSQHCTLFRIKKKQYLIVQSLIDKSFKLLSITFRGLDQGLEICDASFYEVKDRKKFLLTFLVNKYCIINDTLIVQVELDKLLDNFKCSVKTPKDISKIFRNDYSIEKYSTNVELFIDIYTEPAEKRKFDYGMMVKKIKGITGEDMFSSSGRGVIAITSCGLNYRLHLYELETASRGGIELVDDDVEESEDLDDSLIDTDLIG